MRAFISFVFLLNLSSANLYGDYGGYSGYGGYPTGTYYSSGTYGSGVYPGGYVPGPYSSYPGVVGKRDAPTQATADVSPLCDTIDAIIRKAVQSISLSELKSSSYAIKSNSAAMLKSDQGKTSNGEIDKLLVELAANFTAVSALDILNADALREEAYRVSVILRMLKECAERIKILQANGESYRHVLKVVHRLASKLNHIADRVVDLIKIHLSNQANKNDRSSIRRQRPWSFDLGSLYDPDTGYTDRLNLNYKDGENKIGAHLKYNEMSGGVFGISGTWIWE